MSIRPANLSIRPKVLIIKKECVKVKMEKGNEDYYILDNCETQFSIL